MGFTITPIQYMLPVTETIAGLPLEPRCEHGTFTALADMVHKCLRMLVVRHHAPCMVMAEVDCLSEGSDAYFAGPKSCPSAAQSQRTIRSGRVRRACARRWRLAAALEV